MINIDGQLIGINIAIRRDAEGIGFAVPLRRIEAVLASWLVPSRFSLAVCGFVPQTVVRNGETLVKATEIIPDTPADEAGLRDGDLITHVNGQAVNRAMDVGRLIWHLLPGDKIRIKVADKPEKKIKISAMPPRLLVRRRLGLQVQALTKPLCKALGLDPKLRGLAISEVLAGSPLAPNVRRGDIIIRLGDLETEDLDHAFRALKDKRPGDALDVVFLAEVKNRLGQVFLQPFRMNAYLN